MSDCRQCADFDWCAEHEDCGSFKPKPQTNADRIRAMTDEELAMLIHDIVRVEMWRAQVRECSTTETGWLDWLKQEADK